MPHHEPTDPMVCPNCEARCSDWTAMPYPDTATGGDFEGSLVVPHRCDDCGADFEVVYEADKIGY